MTSNGQGQNLETLMKGLNNFKLSIFLNLQYFPFFSPADNPVRFRFRLICRDSPLPNRDPNQPTSNQERGPLLVRLFKRSRIGDSEYEIPVYSESVDDY